jgi:hypothetical protein
MVATSGPIARRFDRLEEPPTTDEGEIVDVDFDAEPSVSERSCPPRPCHVCGDVIDLHADEFVEATVRLDEPNNGFRVWICHPQFCSRECWSEWASN